MAGRVVCRILAALVGPWVVGSSPTMVGCVGALELGIPVPVHGLRAPQVRVGKTARGGQERQDADPMSFLRFTGPVSRYSSLPWPGSYLRSILGRAWPWLLGSSAVGAERDNSLQIVQTLRQFLSSLHQLHMSVFYIHGTYYHVAKRLAGIRYVLLHGSPLETKAVRRAYTLLGLFSLFHLALMLWRHLLLLRGFQRMRQSWTLHRSAHRGTPSSSTQSGRIARCPLCLEARQHATATPCGHIFCWECIASWTSTKAECPLCREKVQPQRLIFLRNFR
uniref:RING-type E3 ubiquitin transferase n=1 Tax=Eptatretus burgeri TaxID=7764 RepID=A0A8C4QID5_EPTBU